MSWNTDASDAPYTEYTLVLRRREAAAIVTSGTAPLTHEQMQQRHGASEIDAECVGQFARQHGLHVVRSSITCRTVVLGGSDEAIQAAFPDAAIPSSLCPIVVAVLQGTRAIGKRSNRGAEGTADSLVKLTSFTPTQLAHLYDFPTNTGKNQTIALIELGGGFKEADLEHYWKQLGFKTAVKVVAVPVDGGANSPTGDSDGPDGEVVLDINVAGALAPDATIVVYFAPNTDAGFLNAINAAIHDTTHKPSVISISWGAAEKEWSVSTMKAFDAAFHDAALLGITVCAAAGDDGSTDGETDKKEHVDFPASSPWVLACGGTRLIAKDGRIETETVWNDGTHGGATGGGVSSVFTRPEYQSHLPGTLQYRGVPDVAALADPQTGYQVFVDGKPCVVGGTSAVAPLWASLIALCNEQLGRNVGFIHPVLYGTFAQNKCLHDVTHGSNGAFRAGTGWDSCTGLGSPNGVAILAALRSSKPTTNPAK